MIEIKGKYNTAVCYTPALEEKAESQIRAVCERAKFSGCKIRIMPDVHAGLGCTIGTTMTVAERVVPGMVGVDIGCGMETVRLSQKDINLEKLDALIREEIPCGRDIREIPHPFGFEIDLTGLRCAKHIKLERARRSIGTLGGGNHFIEVDRGENGGLYLVIHSGSRHLGNEVAKYYQEEGYKALCGNAAFQIADTIAKLKSEGRFREINSTVEKLKQTKTTLKEIPKELSYVEGQLFDDYIHDMIITQKFAMLNRKAMADIIINGMGLTKEYEFTTVHNYIDTDLMILRKGSVSARLCEKLLIPINMRDGSLICTGKGNPEWNFSAPHGAGRLMSRREAFETLSVDDYKTEMAGIFTTCVGSATLDEAPMAYKSMDEIVSQIDPTAEIIERIKPVYNFKAAE